MSKYRNTKPSDNAAPDYPDSIYMIRDAVRRRDELIAGRLSDGHGGACAVGSFWDDNPTIALDEKVIDEVARYNDSVKTSSPRVRRAKVLQWLNWKLQVLAARKPHFARPK